MGGSRSGGKGAVEILTNPIGTLTGNPDLDPLGEIMEQAVQNSIAVAKGEEEFGQHDNWFGEGKGGDQLNTWFGGSTEANRQAWDDYYKQQEQAEKEWQAFMQKNFGSSYQTTPEPGAFTTEVEPKRKKVVSKDTTGTGSLLLEEDT